MTAGSVLLPKLEALIGFIVAFKIKKVVLKLPNKGNK